ncbi:PREDICTED: uncharacterized protein LOC106302511 [Brassica oleracea var. oleracea]|uniref:uncharacterized protein LOC106302511 n=1 Tax=Brassica oleracea var. oleracea TaxID=109376 RepID=UPI0006A6BA32|nr:PREDICTED: uncharacterized protein LOC106302511 [Brassica oleracea var. oleracea]
MKVLETQVAQASSASRAPPGTLPGKPEVNPKAHCNAVSAREDEEAQESEKETEKKVVENGTINLLPKSVEPKRSVKIHACTSSERLYVPRISYPVVSQHLKEPINEKTLAGFKKIMKRIPSTTSFEDAWSMYHLNRFFINTRESAEEIKELFIKTMNASSPIKTLPKLEDLEKFVVPCSISGIKFMDSLCGIGSTVSLMAKDIAERLGLKIESPKLTLEFADSSTKSPQGTVVEMSNGSNRPFILGRAFLATVGAVTDMPNKRISFVKIDESVFYRAEPTNKCTRLASSISVLNQSTHVPISKEDLMDKGQSNAKAKKKLKCKRFKGDPHLMLIPHSCSDGIIDYEVKCKGTSKPFSKVRAVLTSEMKEKGMEVVKGFMSKVLKLKVFDGGTCFGASSHAHLD